MYNRTDKIKGQGLKSTNTPHADIDVLGFYLSAPYPDCAVSQCTEETTRADRNGEQTRKEGKGEYKSRKHANEGGDEHIILT